MTRIITAIAALVLGCVLVNRFVPSEASFPLWHIIGWYAVLFAVLLWVTPLLVKDEVA